MKRLAALSVAVGVTLAWTSAALAFATNSFRFDEMPVRWWYNPANEPPPPPGTTWEEIITAAAQNWADVSCADVSFVYEGFSDAEWAKDAVNVIFWQADDWAWQDGAAAATLHIPELDGEGREVDLALNAADFTWTVGGGDATQTTLLDAESVLTHELGHWLGLAHSPDQFATMYAAKLIGTMQASLDADDKFGICTLYPGGANECVTTADCAAGWTCQAMDELRVCGEMHDPPGAPCSKELLNCDDMCFVSFWECSAICAFTAADLTDGYCARLCLNEGGETFDCPAGTTCRDVPGYPVKACYQNAAPDPEPEAGPEVVEELSLAEPVPETAPDEASDIGADGASDAQVQPEPAPGCAAGGPRRWPHGGAGMVLLLVALGLARLRRRASRVA